ncbi:MAG: nitroreductase family protein [Anaerolineae bacterium]
MPKNAYDPTVTPWTISEDDFPSQGSSAEKLTFLLRYAILAPSSHNTQPWRFDVADDEIRIFVDKSRWLKVADADQRELHISIGCALETLLVAAEHFGYGHRVTLLPDPNDETLAAEVRFTAQGEPASFRPEILFDAIPERHTNHRPYDLQPIPAEDLERLQACVVEDGLDLYLTGDVDIKRQVDELIGRGDALQFSDPAWREELGHWIGQGVFGQSWLMSKMGQLAVTYLNMSKGTAKKDSELLMSAPVLAVITSQEDGRRQQIAVGQAFQRLSLMATALGIRVHPMSQILEFDELKVEVAALIPAENAVPQHTFRLGYAEAEGHTPRRQLAEVLT